MSEEMVVRHCSPTLAKMKTGNMFSCTVGEREELYTFIRALNQTLVKKGLRVLPLRVREGRALIYVYRPKRLKRDLSHAMSAQLLEERHYDPSSSERGVLRLMQRLNESEEFPHEIGLFLGYPPEDVVGFIEHRASKFKCVGTWKVYGDARAAQNTFRKYQKCTSIYCTQYARGKSIERLTVAE